MNNNKSDAKKSTIKLINLYFKYRNCYNSGFQKYSYFKNLMVYVTDIKDTAFLRRIFENLISTHIIEKKLIQKSIRYRYNPTARRDKLNQPIIIYF